MNCPNCGNQLAANAGFCGACGKPVAPQAAAPQPAPQGYPPPAPQGYPPPQQGYPPPPAPPAGFAPQQPGFPPQQPGFPPQQPGFPPPQGYPPSPQGYPPQQGYGQPPYPQQGYGQPPYPQQGGYRPQYGYAPPQPAQTEWKWGYSRFVGITYGPIPVGIIIAIIILIAVYSN